MNFNNAGQAETLWSRAGNVKRRSRAERLGKILGSSGDSAEVDVVVIPDVGCAIRYVQLSERHG